MISELIDQVLAETINFLSSLSGFIFFLIFFDTTLINILTTVLRWNSVKINMQIIAGHLLPNRCNMIF